MRLSETHPPKPKAPDPPWKNRRFAPMTATGRAQGFGFQQAYMIDLSACPDSFAGQISD
jgi:hypothetical protein